MIYEKDREKFATVMIVTWQSLGRNKPDRETMRYWFDKLINYDLQTVSGAFDKWLTNNRELPTIKDILDLCKPKDDYYKLPKKPDIEAQKAGLKKLHDFINQNLKVKRIPQ